MDSSVWEERLVHDKQKIHFIMEQAEKQSANIPLSYDYDSVAGADIYARRKNNCEKNDRW